MFATVTGSNGGITSITLRVASLQFGESKPQHFEFIKNREWLSDDTKAEEPYEYKNLDVIKNYVCLFSSSVDNYVEEKRKSWHDIFF